MNDIKRLNTLLLLLLIWSTSFAPIIAGPMIICIENGVPCQVESASESCCNHETNVTSDLSYSGNNRDCDHCKDTPVEAIAVFISRDTNDILSKKALEVVTDFSLKNKIGIQQCSEFDITHGFVINPTPPQEPIHMRLGATPLIC